MLCTQKGMLWNNKIKLRWIFLLLNRNSSKYLVVIHKDIVFVDRNEICMKLFLLKSLLFNNVKGDKKQREHQ